MCRQAFVHVWGVSLVSVECTASRHNVLFLNLTDANISALKLQQHVFSLSKNSYNSVLG